MARPASDEFPVFGSDRCFYCYIERSVFEHREGPVVQLAAFDFQRIHEVENVGTFEFGRQMEDVLSASGRKLICFSFYKITSFGAYLEARSF